MYQGPVNAQLGRFFEDYSGPRGDWGMHLTGYQFYTIGLYALDELGRPWAYVVDQFVAYDRGLDEKDPERIRKWIPL